MRIPSTLIIAAALGSSFASAATIVQTLAFDGVPDFTAPLVFNKFDGNVADLQEIIVSYDFTIEGGRFVVDNDAETTATVNVKFGASLAGTSTTVRLTDPNFNPVFNRVTVVNEASYVLAPNVGDLSGDYDSSGPDGALLIGTTRNTSGSSSIATAIWGDYVGSDTFTIDMDIVQIGSLSYNSGLETATTPVTANGQITITYVVPEPTSSLLVGIAGIGFAIRRRRI